MRPFIQQMMSVQAAYGGGTLVPFNFQTPAAGYSGAISILDVSGDQGAASVDILSTQFAFDTEAGGGVWGLDIIGDIPVGYLILWMFSGVIFNAGTSYIWSIREGTSTSSDTTVVADAPGTRIGDMQGELDASAIGQFLTGAMYNTGPNSGRDSEWGLYFSQITTNNSQLFNGCLVVIPVQDATGSLAHVGSTLGKRNSEWFSIGPGVGTINFNDQVGGDVDQTSTGGSFTVDHGNEKYLVFSRYRINSNSIATAGDRSLRVTHLIDGVDIHNIRTNLATAGATRTGRGFQYRCSADDGLRHRNGAFRVMTLATGEHTTSWLVNRHDSTDDDETIDGMGSLIIRTSMLSKWVYSEYSQAILVNNSSYVAAPWSVTITSDGTTPIIIGFCTSSHMGGDGYVSTALFRDSTKITEDGASDNRGIGTCNFDNIFDGSIGVGDSDNGTVPITIWWTDTPVAGTYTYTIKYMMSTAVNDGNSNSTIMNCNDNGGSGFTGTLFAFEMKFATVF